MPPKHTPDFDAGVSYWSSQEASNNGVLGGHGNGTLPRVDAFGSRMFLLTLLPYLSTIKPLHHDASLPAPRPSHITRAIDCGAGIGRVTADTLLPLFDRVDLVEPTPIFLEAAAKAASTWRGIADQSKGVRMWKSGLQDFDPADPQERFGDETFGAHDGWDAGRGYDVIWIQWCIGHLTNPQMISFLKRCRNVLRTDSLGNLAGIICVKENLTSGEHDVFDDTDSSWTRSDKTFQTCFRKAGLGVIREEIQQGFPEGLYRVKMYAMR